MGALGGLLTQVEQMMKSQVTTDVVQKVIDMYDDCAMAAFEIIIQQDSLPSASEIAAQAWTIADAMMAERKKRGLGGMPG